MLQHGAAPAALRAADNLMPAQDDVSWIASTETEKHLLPAGNGRPAKGRRVYALVAQRGDDPFMDKLVDSQRGLRKRVAGRNGAGIRPFVVMQDRTAAGQSPHDGQSCQSRNRGGLVSVLKVPQRRRWPSASGTNGPCILPAREPLPEALHRWPCCGRRSAAPARLRGGRFPFEDRLASGLNVVGAAHGSGMRGAVQELRIFGDNLVDRL